MRKINFYFPGSKFPAISVTGPYCGLSCSHCKTKLLERLIPVVGGNALYSRLIAAENQGAKGALITGGCEISGKVPLSPYLNGIKKAKEDTDLTLIAHTGLLSEKDADELFSTGLDGVALDIVGSEETVKTVYGCNFKKEQYLDSISTAFDSGFEIISPHICIGLHYGEIKGEYEAIRMLKDLNLTTLVLTVLMPIIGTPMENVKVSWIDVSSITAFAKANLDVPITFGCARSAGKYRATIDEIAIKNGAAGIAVPTNKALETAESMGLEKHYYLSCCAVPPSNKFETKEIPTEREWIYC